MRKYKRTIDKYKNCSLVLVSFSLLEVFLYLTTKFSFMDSLKHWNPYNMVKRKGGIEYQVGIFVTVITLNLTQK